MTKLGAEGVEKVITEDEDVEEEVQHSIRLRWNATNVITLDISSMNVQNGIKRQITQKKIKNMICC
jgi:hypothetical protein